MIFVVFPGVRSNRSDASGKGEVRPRLQHAQEIGESRTAPAVEVADDEPVLSVGRGRERPLEIAVIPAGVVRFGEDLAGGVEHAERRIERPAEGAGLDPDHALVALAQREAKDVLVAGRVDPAAERDGARDRLGPRRIVGLGLDRRGERDPADPGGLGEGRVGNGEHVARIGFRDRQESRSRGDVPADGLDDARSAASDGQRDRHSR